MNGRKRSATCPPESPRNVYRNQRSQSGEQQPVPATEILELLGDEYTRRVLQAVVERPRTGREIIEAADVSKATAYRRLDELQEAGLVEAETKIDPDGHHRKQFCAVIERLDFEFSGPEFTATMQTESRESGRSPGPTNTERAVLADD
jgi:predicted transcriptional regulator